jgi:hypothetical protein
MTDSPESPLAIPFARPDDGGARLSAQVQGLGFDSARLVVARFAEMFERFQAGTGAAVEAGRFLLLDGSGLRHGSADAGELVLPDVLPGDECSAPLWLHNPTSSSCQGLRLWSPGLSTHDGHTIDGSAIVFNPAGVARVPADSSLQILVIVAVPSSASPGTYHGQVLVEGLPDVAFAVSFNVVGRGGR